MEGDYLVVMTSLLFFLQGNPCHGGCGLPSSDDVIIIFFLTGTAPDSEDVEGDNPV